jgi:rhamnose utilization protein RhaD (predicted bifunctional aldolase and dehydrogenase)
MHKTPEDLLKDVTALSREFGGPDYLKGGGGNTSAKNEDTLWIKPSGTTLLGMRPESFVAIERAKLARLYEETPPAATPAREAWVKDTTAAAVRPGSAGRPSVETPLHNLFVAAYVVHTHPALVNGMTCSRAGAEVCARLFPDALWMEYVDPGYTLCMEAARHIKDYTARHGRQPQALFLANHGVFVAGDTPASIRVLYADIMQRLRAEYERRGVSLTAPVGPPPAPEKTAALRERLAQAPGMDFATAICASGSFTPAEGPFNPDQIVYAKAFPFVGEPTPDALARFNEQNGHPPLVIVWDDAVFGLGETPAGAALTLDLALDSALIRHLTAAFGGPRYMSEAQWDFIRKWEAETYRRRQL